MKRSLYREYRPQTFAELVGQDHVARTLRNAVETDAVAHAYVFAGPRGTGKTSTARILAKALDCVGTDDAPVERPTATPCGVCRHCVAIAGGVSLDVIEMDAASNRSIDDVRDLRDKIAFAPVDGRFKVYIIDEVHMLTREAFNALLKTLEEPPANVVFVLATTEPHKIPETIISRCQRFDFRRPQVRDIARLLATIVERENARPDDERGGPRIEIQEAALEEIARHSQGGFRDAIGTLDKLITYSDGAIKPSDVLEALGVTDADLLFEITDVVTERRTAEALQFVQRLANDGTAYSQFIRDLLRHLRQLFLLQHLEESSRADSSLRALEAGTAATSAGTSAKPARAPAVKPARAARAEEPQAAPAPAAVTAAPDDAVEPGETATEDAATAPPAAAELTLERVKRAWELILQRVQASSVSLYAMLRDARPSGLEDGRLTVTMPSDFALTRARDAGNAELLAGAIEAALGQPLQPEFVPATGVPAEPAGADQAAAPAQSMDFTDLIKQAKGTFDAEEMPDDS